MPTVFRKQTAPLPKMRRLKAGRSSSTIMEYLASWALETYGGYSMENAQEYAFSMMNTLGWNSYGDPEYVPHVLRYYEIG